MRGLDIMRKTARCLALRAVRFSEGIPLADAGV